MDVDTDYEIQEIIEENVNSEDIISKLKEMSDDEIAIEDIIYQTFFELARDIISRVIEEE